MGRALRKTLYGIIGLAGAVHAQGVPLRFDSDVFVERLDRGARVLEHADALHPGDRLVFVVTWSGSAEHGLWVTNPLPGSVAFDPGSTDTQVSVDGGRSYGALPALLVRDHGTLRRALPADVTHVRWRVAGRAGQVLFRGVVR